MQPYRSKALASKPSQRGIGMAYAFAVLAILSVISVMGYSVYAGVTKSNSQSQNRTLSGNLLDLATAALSVESKDLDGDGQPEAPAMVALDGASNCNGTGAAANCFIPATSAAPKSDAWGSPIRYCAWDHGAVNTTTSRIIDGNDNPATQNSVVFALISAGPDKIFQTTCADAKAGTRKGDDGYRKMTVFLINKGNGGTVYFGDPVEDLAALNSLVPASGYTPQNGEQRILKSTGQVYYWMGTAWANQVPVAGLVANSNDNCDRYGIRAIATDLMGSLMVCQ